MEITAPFLLHISTDDETYADAWYIKWYSEEKFRNLGLTEQGNRNGNLENKR